MFLLYELLSSLLNGLNTIFIGIKLSLKILVFLNFGLKIGGVLIRKRSKTLKASSSNKSLDKLTFLISYMNKCIAICCFTIAVFYLFFFYRTVTHQIAFIRSSLELFIDPALGLITVSLESLVLVRLLQKLSAIG